MGSSTILGSLSGYSINSERSGINGFHPFGVRNLFMYNREQRRTLPKAIDPVEAEDLQAGRCWDSHGLRSYPDYPLGSGGGCRPNLSLKALQGMPRDLEHLVNKPCQFSSLCMSKSCTFWKISTVLWVFYYNTTIEDAFDASRARFTGLVK